MTAYAVPWQWDVARPGLPDRDYVVLWHGCLGKDATSIRSKGIDPTLCQPDTDFGRGFYLTTTRRQANYWARERYDALSPAEQKKLDNHPILLRFRVKRQELAMLEALHLFVRGEHANQEYWSLVCHCRSSTRIPLHICCHKLDRSKNGAPATRVEWYDIVTGPVAAYWKQRQAFADYDQISFHTVVAARVLNDCIHSTSPERFRLVAVEY